MTTRKIVYLFFILILLGFGYFFYRVLNIADLVHPVDEYDKDNINPTYCSDSEGEEMDCKKCKKIGKIIMHGAGFTCEVPAKDSGKNCQYDDECTKGECIYNSEDAESGTCLGVSGGSNNCHRKRGEKVGCDDFFFD